MNSDAELMNEVRTLRARLYALESRLNGVGSEELPTAEFDVLVCRVGHEPVAFALENVDEVVPVADMSELPEAPPWVPGLLDVRGVVLPVVDVAARVSRSRRQAELSDLVVMAHDDSSRVGLLVQEVYDVGRLHPRDLQPPTGDLPHGPYLLGAFRSRDGACLLFSIRRLISHSSIPELDLDAPPSEDVA